MISAFDFYFEQVTTQDMVEICISSSPIFHGVLQDVRELSKNPLKQQ